MESTLGSDNGGLGQCDCLEIPITIPGPLSRQMDDMERGIQKMYFHTNCKLQGAGQIVFSNCCGLSLI